MNIKQIDHYAIKLASELLKACENKTADFLNTVPFPYYTQDMFSKQVLRGAGQLKTLLNNAVQGSPYINYTPTFIVQDSKKEWINNIKKNHREIGCIVYKGKDANGNKHYEMISPAKKLIPNVMNESPMTQDPLPKTGVHRQEARLDINDPKGIEKYITTIISNYFNAALTKTPYFAPKWGKDETAMLANALNAKPEIALSAPREAFSQAVNPDNHVKEPVKQNGYIPYQTHYESPKNTDKYLVEQYSNMINARLTGTPYTGSVSEESLREKTLKEPEYMAKIASQAKQNVQGFNYMPYDKDAFIKNAQDYSSGEFKVLSQTITSHVSGMVTNNQKSYNGEFQELSKQLIDKIKNTNIDTNERKPFIAKEVTEFIKENIKKIKPALVLVDTYLGGVIDKAQKIVRTGKTIAAAFVIATNLLAPNLQLTVADHLSKIPVVNKVSISVNHDDYRGGGHGQHKTVEHHQHQHVNSIARR
jgi:hypothetical protein